MSRLLILLFVTFFILYPISRIYAYPQEEYDECILASKANPAILGVPDSSIKNFCNCALKEIVDKGKNARISANECVRKHLNK